MGLTGNSIRTGLWVSLLTVRDSRFPLKLEICAPMREETVIRRWKENEGCVKDVNYPGPFHHDGDRVGVKVHHDGDRVGSGSVCVCVGGGGPGVISF